MASQTLNGSHPIATLANLQPFSQAIMGEQVPPHYMVPKMTSFSRLGNPESYLKAFSAQMFIPGGSNSIRCKMFVDTFIWTTVHWFSEIPDRAIDSF